MNRSRKILISILVMVIAFYALFSILQYRSELILRDPIGEAALFEEEAHYIEVEEEGYRVRYITRGQGEENIIFIHGLGATAYTWRHLLDPFSEKYTVYALDLIGFGMSDKPDVALSPRFFADFMADFMEAAGIDTAHLAGNSLGGAVAASTALWYPEKVGKVVLIAAGGYDDLAEHRPFLVRLSRLPVVGEGIILLSQVSPQGVVRSTLEESAYNKEFIDDTLVHEFARGFVTPGYRKFLLNFTRHFSYAELENNLGNIEHETLILWGENDQWIPLEFAYRFFEDLPHAKLVVIENCGHEPQEEHPEITVDAIKRFLFEPEAKDPAKVGEDINPARVDLENGTIEIIGFKAQPESTCLMLLLEKAPAFRVFPGFDEDSDTEVVRERLNERLKQIYLIDNQGGEYRYQEGNFAAEHLLCTACAGGTTWSTKLYLELPPLAEQAEIITLVLPLYDDLELRTEFPLAVLEETGECPQLGGTISW